MLVARTEVPEMNRMLRWVMDFEDELVEQAYPPIDRRIAHALGVSLYDPTGDPRKAAGGWAAFRRSLRTDHVRDHSSRAC